MAMSVGTTALGQADARPSQDRQTTYPRSHDQAGQKTLEGKLVPLFDALSKGESMSRSQGLRPSTQPGSSTQPRTGSEIDSSRQPGQVGTSTQPGTSTQTGVGSQSGIGTPGIGTQPTPGAQPGTGAQSGTAGQPSARTQPDSSSYPDSTTQPDSSTQGFGMSQMAQPLALVCDPESKTETSTTGVRTPGAGQSSTPGASQSQSERSQDTERTAGTARYDSSTEKSGIYVLVFDPEDPQSRSAYMMAQAIARSGSTGSTIGSPSIGGTPGTPRSTATDRQPVRDPATSSLGSASSSEEVKVTGRVIEREGIQAIAVQSIERKHGSSSSPSSTPGANQ
jgi:hypothetical protein